MSIAENANVKTPYETYKGLPPLAGLMSMPEALRPGLSVMDCVARLKRYHYALKRLHGIFTARITAEPVYELKMAFSLHALICAEHVDALRRRIREMRTPPLGLDEVPDENLALFFDEILGAPTTEALVYGLYAKAIPAVLAAFGEHQRVINRLMDHQSFRVCRFAEVELREIDTYGQQAVACLVDAPALAGLAAWPVLLDHCLALAGGLDGSQAVTTGVVARQFSATPYVYDGVPKRDGRFKDSYNMGVNAEAFLFDPTKPAQPKTLMMFFKRLREIDVPEMMASILTETSDKPWEYYRDMSRQLWDEARHAMMGETGFYSLGIDWRTIPVNFTWSLGLNTQLKPIERHAVLFFIEQGLMNTTTGKRAEWEIAVASANPLSAMIQDYDWADEVLHYRIGKDWYVDAIGSREEAIAYGDACWSRVLSDWEKWRQDGLTQHRNWWPEVYRDACARWGVTPDAAILAYDQSYNGRRADLRDVQTVSG